MNFFHNLRKKKKKKTGLFKKREGPKKKKFARLKTNDEKMTSFFS